MVIETEKLNQLKQVFEYEHVFRVPKKDGYTYAGYNGKMPFSIYDSFYTINQAVSLNGITFTYKELEDYLPILLKDSSVKNRIEALFCLHRFRIPFDFYLDIIKELTNDDDIYVKALAHNLMTVIGSIDEQVTIECLHKALSKTKKINLQYRLLLLIITYDIKDKRTNDKLTNMLSKQLLTDYQLAELIQADEQHLVYRFYKDTIYPLFEQLKTLSDMFRTLIDELGLTSEDEFVRYLDDFEKYVNKKEISFEEKMKTMGHSIFTRWEDGEDRELIKQDVEILSKMKESFPKKENWFRRHSNIIIAIIGAITTILATLLTYLLSR